MRHSHREYGDRGFPTGRCDIEPSFSGKFVSAFVDFAVTRGADRDHLVDLAALPPALLGREDVRLPCSTMATVWSAAMEQTGDEHLALRLGASPGFGANRTTSLIMESSATVLESFQLAARYSTLIADVMAVTVGEADGTVSIDFQPETIWRDQDPAVQLDCLGITYVSAATSLRRLLGRTEIPTLLSVTFPRPATADVWTDTFGRPVDFGAATNRIGFPADLTSAPVATADPGLMAAVREYADGLAAAVDTVPPTTRAVTSALVDGMGATAPTLDDVARSLGMSRRSLQRSLRAEETSFREISERVRVDLAERALREGDVSVEQVAGLVGYADASSFVRAFKRVRGQPPRRFVRSIERPG